MLMKRDSFGMRLLASFLVLAACAAMSVAQAAGERGGGANRGGGGKANTAKAGNTQAGARAGNTQASNAKADARSNNVRNTSVNNVNNSSRNTNVNNSNRNTNVNQNVNVNVNSNGGGGCCYNNNGWDNDYHPLATAAAVTATVAMTSAVIGSMTQSVPSNCVPINYGGMIYQQCGTTWYQPQGSQFVVVNPPY
jgi:hypothetical protein